MPKSRVKGVKYEKDRKKWAVQFKVDGKDKRFGRYKSKEEAERVALKLRKKYHPDEKTPFKD